MGKDSDLATDTLGNSILIVETMKEISSAVAHAPGLGPVLGASLGLLKAVERVKGAEDRSRRLAGRAVEFMQYIEQRVLRDDGTIDDDVVDYLSALTYTIEQICVAPFLSPPSAA
ncbi:hypothetical protein OBBRIDRAFT_798021 [Obba rivulosa]|uniref:Uncharacterized protein n=1 Tax=Obba rivulosa TaxID=1052685 RepID=A0A8E2DK94_9APHY|nr:hypothetical protein OBBRIDRAFT_798021 [Obba rivulosa]